MSSQINIKWAKGSHMEEDQVSSGIRTHLSLYYRRIHQTVVVFVQGMHCAVIF